MQLRFLIFGVALDLDVRRQIDNAVKLVIGRK